SSSLFAGLRCLPPGSPLFPYTTLFRSREGLSRHAAFREARIASVNRHSNTLGARDCGKAAEWVPNLRSFGAKMDGPWRSAMVSRSEEHTSELQSRENLVCRLLLEKKKQ